MSGEELPYGELGDLMEALVPIATNLVQVIREEGPTAVQGTLLRMRSLQEQMPADVADRLCGLEGGMWGALALVLAAMVDPDARMRAMLGWTEELIDGPGAERVVEERIRESAARERARLSAAGVRTAAETLAGPVGAAQQNTTTRMLHVIHGGKAV